MSPKVHRSASGMTRHARSTSGGSSKVALNLHFTQKDPVTTQVVRKAKLNGLHRHESPAPPAGYPSRTTSEHRIQAKTAAHQAPASKTVSNPSQRPPHVKAKTDFTISQAEGDDDEWVSSESAPATPNNQSDDEGVISPTDSDPTPVDGMLSIPGPVAPNEQIVTIHTVESGNEAVTTPRANINPLPRRHPSSSQTSLGTTTQESETPTLSQNRSQSQKVNLLAESRDTQDREQNPTMIEVQAMDKQSQNAYRHDSTRPASSRHSTRPNSIYSITTKTDISTRPHPLIRRQSLGPNPLLALRPAPLAPLTTIPANETLVINQVSSSPPVLSPDGLSHRSTSPASSSRASLALHDRDASSEARKQLRRQSTSSSQASVATIPYQSTVSRSTHDRQRTLSTMSTSSIAALSPFIHSYHVNAPPRSPVAGFTSHFPPGDESNGVSELIHSLLPPPYLCGHLTMLVHRNPIRESYERVFRAKRLQQQP